MTITLSISQDLSSYDLLANYTLINTTKDKTGYSEDVELKNTPFKGQDGIYCNGVYNDGIDQNGSYMTTPSFPDWTLDDVAASVEFKFTDKDFNCPVIMFGNTLRYFGSFINKSKICMLYLGAERDINLEIDADKWYKLTLIYKDSIGKMYINNTLVDSFKFGIDLTYTSDFYKKISNEHNGIGYLFKGYLKNLKVYGHKKANLIIDQSNENELTVFPNPTMEGVTIKTNDLSSINIKLFDLQGKQLSTKSIRHFPYYIDLTFYDPGIYFIQLYDNEQILKTFKIEKIK